MLQPLTTKETLMSTVNAIANSLLAAKEDAGKSDASLYVGTTGEFIFFLNLFLLDPNPIYHDAGALFIDKSIDAIENQLLDYTLCAGLSGIAWGIVHLAKQNLIGIENESFFSELDNHIYEYALKDIKIKGNVDILYGGLGAMVYFLERLPNEDARNYLGEIVNELWLSAVVEMDEVKWINSFNSSYTVNSIGDEYNLGLAHGITGIIAVLCKVYDQQIEQDRCSYLINGSINWLLKQKLPETFYSIFPTAVGKDIEVYNSRLGWCYGDLPIAWVLYQAGISLNRKEWQQEAIRIMLHASKRRELEKNEVLDAGICHGTAGIAHLFNRFYHKTQEPDLKEAANYWINETIKMAKFEDGLAGYKAWHGKKGWNNCTGLLEGIAGIGIVLISAINENETPWDACLLM